MSVSNGQIANQTTFNNAFMSRTSDTTATGKVDLLNADAESGDAVENIQREHNGVASFTGRTPGGDFDELPAWTNNDVGSPTDNLKDRADSLTAEFDPSTGHDHDGVNSPLIAADDLDDVVLRGYFKRAQDLSGVTGTSYDVSTPMSGKSPSSGDNDEGVVVTAPYNKILLRDFTAATRDDVLKSAAGDIIYGRLTESSGTWTLSFYTDVAGVETAYNFLVGQDIAWYYQELHNPITNAPVYSEEAFIPSDNATQDVLDASSTQRGLVSTGAQSIGGVKTFADTTQSTTKDNGAVVIEGGLGVEKNINAGGNIAATGTVAGSNLSGTNTGDVTLAAVGSSPNANGASLSGQALNLQPASSSFPGVMTAIAQTFAGVKTWVNGMILQAYLALNRLDVASTATIAQLSSAKSFVKLTGTTATTIQGIAAGADGQVITIHNGTNQVLTLAHDDGGATAADRFKLPNADDITVDPDSSAEFIYDTNQSRWVIKSGSGSGSGGGGALLVTGTRGSPQAITAGGGIAFTGDDARQMWFIEGDGGPIDVSANPQIAAATTVGQELIIFGTSDDNTVLLEEGTGLELNGEALLGDGDKIGLVWDGSVWSELFRNF